MLNELLLTIKEKFSDVLIPSDCIKKQDQVGKGKDELRSLSIVFHFNLLSFSHCIILGAFGVVHKGELTNADGSVIPIASKTITCTYVIM